TPARSAQHHFLIVKFRRCDPARSLRALCASFVPFVVNGFVTGASPTETYMTETILLGGRQFELRPLKLGQLRHLLDALDGMAGKSGGGLIEAAAGLVVAGLAPAHPDLGADAVLDLD